MAVDNAIRVLREQCDLDEDMIHELAQRVASGEIERPVWTKNDGTLTVNLLGDEGKVLGETAEDFVELLELVMEQIKERMPDVEYSVTNGLPALQANFDFCRPEADGMAEYRTRRSVERLTIPELEALRQACTVRLNQVRV
jgi:hypothetical protein